MTTGGRRRARDDGCRRAMAVGALVALGAVAGGRSVSAKTIPTLVGNYVTSTATETETLGAGPNNATSADLVTSALAHGDEAAHIIAELRTSRKRAIFGMISMTTTTRTSRSGLKIIPFSLSQLRTSPTSGLAPPLRRFATSLMSLSRRILSRRTSPKPWPSRKPMRASWKRCVKSSKRRCGTR